MRRLVTYAMLTFISLGACQSKQSMPYEDKTHFSTTFGHEKAYRIYFPEHYSRNNKAFPVIYFMHGWGGRHFKDDNAKFDYVKIDSLVKANDVILVMLDGNIEEREPRPYNIGNHTDVKYEIQFKDYFLEFINHIDSTYRTVAERNSRAIIGYSMGGFMSTFLAGKYPHLICAQANLTGSPEFFVGYPENHTLYSLKHAYGNLHGVSLRMHNSTSGELAYLNREVIAGAIREKGIEIEYEEFEGGHKVDLPGEIVVLEKAFTFICNKLRDKSIAPERWHHLDIYPEFEIWDYNIQSNKDEPGFIELKGVTENGFFITSKKWLPDGPPLTGLAFNILTPPIYNPENTYKIFEYDRSSGKHRTYAIKSDKNGRISIDIEGSERQIGIWGYQEQAELVFLNYRINNTGKYLSVNEAAQIEVQVLNRGSAEIKNFNMLMEAKLPGFVFQDSLQTSIEINAGECKWLRFPTPLHIDAEPPLNGSPHMLRVDLEFKNPEMKVCIDEFDIPILYNLNELPDIQIDDGRLIKENQPILGIGNGNGLAEAGESIVIYSEGHPTRLFYDCPWVLKKHEELLETVLPAKWPDGYTLFSRIKIHENTQPGQHIEFQANFETKEYMPINRILHWGKIKIQVY